jgi:hypothetical protein
MAKAIADIRSLARAHTRSAIGTLAAIMTSEDATAAARVAAANALLDRGWGKPPQAHTNEDGAPFAVLQRIERVIVEGQNPASPDGSVLQASVLAANDDPDEIET